MADRIFTTSALYFPETVQPQPNLLPRFHVYVHQITNSPAYNFNGKVRHSENHCIFHYTIRGEGMTYNRFGKERVLPGQGFLSLINDPDSGYEYPEDGTEEWEFLCFGFDMGNSMELIGNLIETYGQIYTVDIHAPIFREMIDLSLSGETPVLSAHESANFFYRLYTTLVRTAVAKTEVAVHPLVEQVKRLTLSQLPEELDVACLAAQIGYSRGYLSRTFHQETGMTVKAYIDNERMKQACLLLKQTNLTMTEIAEKLHYSSSSNFLRSFKNHMGISPLSYRKSEVPLSPFYTDSL